MNRLSGSSLNQIFDFLSRQDLLYVHTGSSDTVRTGCDANNTAKEMDAPSLLTLKTNSPLLFCLLSLKAIGNSFVFKYIYHVALMSIINHIWSETLPQEWWISALLFFFGTYCLAGSSSKSCLAAGKKLSHSSLPSTRPEVMHLLWPPSCAPDERHTLVSHRKWMTFFVRSDAISSPGLNV